jgi:hypothetical protein
MKKTQFKAYETDFATHSVLKKNIALISMSLFQRNGIILKRNIRQVSKCDVLIGPGDS